MQIYAGSFLNSVKRILVTISKLTAILRRNHILVQACSMQSYCNARSCELHRSMTETQDLVSFPWFLSRFLLVSISWLLLRIWCCPFSLHVPTISTFFAWWRCLFFPFRPLIFYPLWQIYLLYSPQPFMHECVHHVIIIFFVFQLSIEKGDVECWN